MSEKLKNLLSDLVFENELSNPSLKAILKSCSEYQNFTNKVSDLTTRPHDGCTIAS